MCIIYVSIYEILYKHFTTKVNSILPGGVDFEYIVVVSARRKPELRKKSGAPVFDNKKILITENFVKSVKTGQTKYKTRT